MDLGWQVVAVVAAATLAWLLRPLVERLPEPPDPAPDKPLYAEVVRRRAARPVVTAGAALGAALVAWRLDEPALLPAWVLVCGVGVWLAWIDGCTRYLPYRIVSVLYVATLVLVGGAALVLRDGDLAVRAAVVNVVLYLLYRVLHAVARFGYGDVTFAGVLGLVLGAAGVEQSIVGTYAAFVLAAVVSIGLAVRHRRMKGIEIAFGPYMLAGAVLGVAVGTVVY